MHFLKTILGHYRSLFLCLLTIDYWCFHIQIIVDNMYIVTQRTCARGKVIGRVVVVVVVVVIHKKSPDLEI